MIFSVFAWSALGALCGAVAGVVIAARIVLPLFS